MEGHRGGSGQWRDIEGEGQWRDTEGGGGNGRTQG